MSDEPIIKTRTGIATGQMNERQMLDSRDDSNGIRTIIRDFADGSTTLCRTRAGFVEFITTKPEGKEEEKTPLFLETGHTELPSANTLAQYYGLANGRGKWWFKVATDQYWLSYIKTPSGIQWKKYTGKIMSKLGDTPVEPELLYDGMISPATSIREASAFSSDWIDAMLKKREAMQKCPASMFSGKMRLFMQAQYGGLLDTKQDEDGYFRVEGSGFSVRFDGVVFGNLGGVGVGLYTTADNEYRIIKISGTDVTIYPLKPKKDFKEPCKKLLAELRGTTIGADREKAEAYLFAHMEIDKENIVSYPGVVPATYPITYGWSFDWGANNADIISVESTGSGSGARWLSTHQHLDIAHWLVDGVDNWSFTASTISTETWLDGRGSYHIFTPVYGLSAEMVAFTLNNSAGIPCTGKFYCFYKKNGELVICNYTKGAVTSKPTYYWNDADHKGNINNESPSYNSASVVVGRRTATYKVISGETSGTELFAVGSETYGGSYRSATETVTVVNHGMGGVGTVQVRPMAAWVVAIEAYGCGYEMDGWAAFRSAADPYYIDPYVFRANYWTWTAENLGRTDETHVDNVTRKYHTAVIPYFDCCAIMVYERDAQHSGAVNYTMNYVASFDTTYGSQSTYNHTYDPPGGSGPLFSGLSIIGNDSLGFGTVVGSGTETRDLGPPIYARYTTHFHSSLTDVPSEPDSQLVNLFYVNIYFTYSGQIWTSVNAGGSSAQDSVTHPNASRRWTGWV